MSDAKASDATPLDGRFERVERVPACGRGETWRARDLQVRGRAVLVKLLPPCSDRRLDDGLKRVKSFRHGNTLALLHHGTVDGRPYLVHDAFDGTSLAAMLARAWREKAPIPRAALERLSEKLCEALDAAHGAVPPLAHGALDAASVLVRMAPSQQPDLRVVDFALGGFCDPAALPEGVAARAFSYPPTRATGVDADLVGLARVLRAMCAASDDDGAPATPGLDWRRDDVPEAVWSVIRRAMAPRRAERFADVSSLLQALQTAWEEPARGPVARPSTTDLADEDDAPAAPSPPEAPPIAAPPAVVEATPSVALPSFATPPPATGSFGTAPSPVTLAPPERGDSASTARIDGRYEVGTFVAQGGCGAVYRGRHPLLKRDVAIKVLKWREMGDAATRQALYDAFLQEAQTIARLDHPAIVRVMDFGRGVVPGGEEAPWMVLEWVEGDTLAQQLAAKPGRRTPAACMAVLRPVFEALAVAHAAGVAHRDIKPSNLMIPTRGDGSARVLDFGIARLMDDDATPASGETHTQGQLNAYSLPYASPEQVSATRTGPWTDVHALALVLTEMLVGAPAYRGDDRMALVAEAIRDARPTPGRFHVDVGAWEPVLAKALALRPADRYPDAGAFLRALLDTLPASAPAEASVAPATPAARTTPMPAPAPATVTPVEVAPPTSRGFPWGVVAALGVAALLGILWVSLRAPTPRPVVSTPTVPTAPTPTPAVAPREPSVAPREAVAAAPSTPDAASELDASARELPASPQPASGRSHRARGRTLHGLRPDQI